MKNIGLHLFNKKMVKFEWCGICFFELWVYQSYGWQGGKVDLTHEYLPFSKTGEKTQFNEKSVTKAFDSQNTSTNRNTIGYDGVEIGVFHKETDVNTVDYQSKSRVVQPWMGPNFFTSSNKQSKNKC